MRVAIYARFSSDLQDARSIADQVAAARDHAARQGWTVVSEHVDAAISGASLANRPALAALVVAAQARAFDAILTESLDRLSRDLADISALWRDLSYLGIRIFSLAEGDIGFLQVGLKGIVGQMYLADLAHKTRRGQVGRVKAGKIPGGRCYGYDVIAGAEGGARSINEAEAGIVRRIFAEYLDGRSPRAIAGRLNAEDIRSPRGGQWNASTINGSRLRLNGIISNRLYSGRIVYNRQRFVKDPKTGKRQARPNPPDQWIEREVPELAIVPADQFAAAQLRRADLGGAQRLDRRRRPKHLLSGLVICGCCGASMIVVRDDRVGCSAQRNRHTCTNRRTIRLEEIERRILAALESYLLAPDVVAAAVEAYREERARLAKDHARAQREAERNLAAVDRRIAGVITAIEAGGDPRALAQRLNELEAERRAIVTLIPKRAAGEVIALHPQAAGRYRAKVADIRATLGKGDAAAHEAITLVRDLIERISVTPTAAGEPLQLELAGNLAALLQEPSHTGGAIVVVAGAGFEPTTFRL